MASFPDFPDLPLENRQWKHKTSSGKTNVKHSKSTGQTENIVKRKMGEFRGNEGPSSREGRRLAMGPKLGDGPLTPSWRCDSPAGFADCRDLPQEIDNEETRPHR